MMPRHRTKVCINTLVEKKLKKEMVTSGRKGD